MTAKEISLKMLEDIASANNCLEIQEIIEKANKQIENLQQGES
jgi:hypothetical protein